VEDTAVHSTDQTKCYQTKLDNTQLNQLLNSLCVFIVVNIENTTRKHSHSPNLHDSG